MAVVVAAGEGVWPDVLLELPGVAPGDGLSLDMAYG